MKGYIKDYRQEMKSDIWLMPPLYHRVWQWLKYMVNHEDNEIPMRDGSKFLIKKGQHMTSLRDIAQGVGWYEGRKWKEPNPKTISSILSWLEKQEMILVDRGKGNRQYTLISLLNWDLYQSKNDKGNSKETVSGTDSKQSVDINKNDKNEKNDKNIPATAEKVGWYDKFYQCFNRVPTAIQIDSIHHFLDDGVEEDLLMLAFEKAGLKNATFRYSQQILTEWVQKGIKTIEQGKEESRKFNVIKGGKPNGQNGRDSAQAKREGVTGGKVGRLFDTGFTGNLDEYDFF